MYTDPDRDFLHLDLNQFLDACYTLQFHTKRTLIKDQRTLSVHVLYKDFKGII